LPYFFSQPVSPGDVISIKVGEGGKAAMNRAYGGNAEKAADGGTGGSTVITFPLRTITLTGANGGGGADASPITQGVAGSTPTVLNQMYTTGGVGFQAYIQGTAGQSNMYADGGASNGDLYSGGGGGAGRLAGSSPGTLNGDSPVPVAGSGAGGGGGSVVTTDKATRSAWGGSGYVRFSWE
jgi:hypothetical protein